MSAILSSPILKSSVEMTSEVSGMVSDVVNKIQWHCDPDPLWPYLSSSIFLAPQAASHCVETGLNKCE